jgi:hypothetical protein
MEPSWYYSSVAQSRRHHPSSARERQRGSNVCEFDRPPAAAAADRAEFNIGRPTSRRRRRTLVPRCDGQVHVDSGRSAADVAQLGLANQWFILPFGDSAAAVDPSKLSRFGLVASARFFSDTLRSVAAVTCQQRRS